MKVCAAFNGTKICTSLYYFQMTRKNTTFLHVKAHLAIIYMVFSLGCAKANEFTIMPGHSLGKVQLGASHATVRKLWGQPYHIQRQFPYRVEYWRVGQAYKAATFKNTKVIQLQTNSSRFVTPHGISVKSKLRSIPQVLGKMHVIILTAEDQYYDSCERGIAFEFGSELFPGMPEHLLPRAVYVHYPKSCIVTLKTNEGELTSSFDEWQIPHEGLRVVAESVLSQSNFEAVAHYRSLYDGTVRISIIDELSISPSGKYAVFSNDKGRTLLYKRGSMQLKDVTPERVCSIDNVRWNDQKSEVVINYRQSQSNSAYTNCPSLTVQLDSKP